jgi:pre-mRNA-splicing factor CWC26
MTQEEFLESKAAERAKKAAQHEDESQLAWGGGLRQRHEAEQAEREMREEAAKPFAR